MYDHVLVGTDGSATATRAVEAAARLAQAHRARLTVAHAFRAGRVVAVPAASGRPDEFPWLLTSGAAAEALVNAAADRAQSVACGGLRIDVRAEPGDPVSVLVALVRELDPDAVVVGNADAFGPRVRRSVGYTLSRRTSADIVIVDTADRRPHRRGRSAA